MFSDVVLIKRKVDADENLILLEDMQTWQAKELYLQVSSSKVGLQIWTYVVERVFKSILDCLQLNTLFNDDVFCTFSNKSFS